MSIAEESLLAVFRAYRMDEGKMLCFFGAALERHHQALAQLTDRGLLVKERFRGGYALTASGFAAMIASSKTAGGNYKTN